MTAVDSPFNPPGYAEFIVEVSFTENGELSVTNTNTPPHSDADQWILDLRFDCDFPNTFPAQQLVSQPRVFSVEPGTYYLVLNEWLDMCQIVPNQDWWSFELDLIFTPAP